MTMRSAMVETMGFQRFSPRLSFGKARKWLQQRNNPRPLRKLDMFALSPVATCFVYVPSFESNDVILEKGHAKNSTQERPAAALIGDSHPERGR